MHWFHFKLFHMLENLSIQPHISINNYFSQYSTNDLYWKLHERRCITLPYTQSRSVFSTPSRAYTKALNKQMKAQKLLYWFNNLWTLQAVFSLKSFMAFWVSTIERYNLKISGRNSKNAFLQLIRNVFIQLAETCYFPSH